MSYKIFFLLIALFLQCNAMMESEGHPAPEDDAQHITFTHIRAPKTASRSLIKKNPETDKMKTRAGNHLNVPDSLKFIDTVLSAETAARYRTFSFVRNPFSRLRSAFYHLYDSTDKTYMPKPLAALQQAYPDADFEGFYTQRRI